jgi:hypothetical protein
MPNLPNFRRQAMGDVVPAMLEPGEFVINRKAVNALGVDNLEVLNAAGGAHNAIDELIASATVANSLQNAKPPHFQEGGEVPSSWGQRFVERFPSRHKDPERAVGQERGLSNVIDALSMLVPGIDPAALISGSREISKLIPPKVADTDLDYGSLLVSSLLGPFGGRAIKHWKKQPNKGKQQGGPVGYQNGGEVGSAPTFGSKSLAFLDKQMDRLGIKEEKRDAFTENMFDFSRQVRNVESDNNRMAAADSTSAKGVYQFTDASVATGRNRMANLGFEDKFTSGISSNPQEWSDEQADSMFLANMFAQKGSDKYLKEIGRGDEKARQEAYYKFHHTNPDEATTGRVNKLMPYTAKRSDMSGSILGYQQGGQVEQLEYREPQVQGNNLMGMSNDRRVMPVLPPDEYVMRQENGEMLMSKQQVPKLSPAYMASFGMETPLSKRQRSLLQRRAINPESISPQLHGLLGKVLLQRLENEPE